MIIHYGELFFSLNQIYNLKPICKVLVNFTLKFISNVPYYDLVEDVLNYDFLNQLWFFVKLILAFKIH